MSRARKFQENEYTPTCSHGGPKASASDVPGPRLLKARNNLPVDGKVIFERLWKGTFKAIIAASVKGRYQANELNRKSQLKSVISVKESHQIAEANQEKNQKLKEALGISQFFIEGSSLDPEKKAKEAAAVAAEAQKKYLLIQESSSSPSPEREKKRKKKKKASSARDRSESSEPPKKKKSSKKHRRERSLSPELKKKRKKKYSGKEKHKHKTSHSREQRERKRKYRDRSKSSISSRSSSSDSSSTTLTSNTSRSSSNTSESHSESVTNRPERISRHKKRHSHNEKHAHSSSKEKKNKAKKSCPEPHAYHKDRKAHKDSSEIYKKSGTKKKERAPSTSSLSDDGLSLKEKHRFLGTTEILKEKKDKLKDDYARKQGRNSSSPVQESLRHSQQRSDKKRKQTDSSSSSSEDTFEKTHGYQRKNKKLQNIPSPEYDQSTKRKEWNISLSPKQKQHETSTSAKRHPRDKEELKEQPSDQSYNTQKGSEKTVSRARSLSYSPIPHNRSKSYKEKSPSQNTDKPRPASPVKVVPSGKDKKDVASLTDLSKQHSFSGSDRQIEAVVKRRKSPKNSPERRKDDISIKDSNHKSSETVLHRSPTPPVKHNGYQRSSSTSSSSSSSSYASHSSHISHSQSRSQSPAKQCSRSSSADSETFSNKKRSRSGSPAKKLSPHSPSHSPPSTPHHRRSPTSSCSRSASHSSHHSKERYRSHSKSCSPVRRRSRSSSHSHSSRSASLSYRHSSRSRSRSNSSRSRSYVRSPSIPRRRGSPSFLDKRRITSARKRPVPYRRPSPPTPSSLSSWSSHSRSQSRTPSPSRSRSCSRSYRHSSSQSRSRSRSWSPVNEKNYKNNSTDNLRR